MTDRTDIDAIWADAEGNKTLREARFRALRLMERLQSNLPHSWQPRAQVTIAIKKVAITRRLVFVPDAFGDSFVGLVRGRFEEREYPGLDLTVDVTIRGATKSLSEWTEGRRTSPDWVVINPPMFTDDPGGDVEIPVYIDGVQTGTRRGFDDFVRAIRVAFYDKYRDPIAAILRNGAP